MTSASLPLMRTIPMPPSPGGVDTAHMVSCSCMAVYYHKRPGIKNEFRSGPRGGFYATITPSRATTMKSQDLKKIAEKYSADQLEACIRQQLDKGENAC